MEKQKSHYYSISTKLVIRSESHFMEYNIRVFATSFDVPKYLRASPARDH